jgi:hypothetical protein
MPKPAPFPCGAHHSAIRSSSHGLVAWASAGGSKPGLWLCPDPAKGQWEPLVEPGKSGIPAHYCENSGLVWDFKRDRMLLFDFKPEDRHKVRAYDFKSRAVSVLDPGDGGRLPASAIFAWAACYLPDDDLVLVTTPGKPDPLTLFYDCAANEWLRMDNVADRDKAGKLLVPDGYYVSNGMMWDPARKLIWAGAGYMPGGKIWAMKFDRKTANLKPAGGG